MSQTNPIKSGIRRGVQMGTSPNPERLRELRETARSKDRLTTAWSRVGQSIQFSMTEASRSSRG